MEKIFDKLLIIDGSYMLHRSLHIPEVFELKASNGERTGGIFGFLRTLISELRICGDYFPVVCFDEGLAPRRTKADPHYKKADERDAKENNVVTPEEADIDYITQYRKQRNKLIEILMYFGVPCLKFIPWEGDDLMYILSKISEDSLVLTDDRDMLQLLSESCRVRRPMADEMWTLDSFLKSKDMNDIYDFVLWKAIRGDGSDNIPGCCKGVGEASVNDFIKLLYTFRDSLDNWDFSAYPSTVEEMKNWCESFDIKYKKAYLNFNEDRFFTNLELVDLNKVEMDESVFSSIISTVSNCKTYMNYFSAAKLLGSLEIRDISIDFLMESVSLRYNHLLKEGK